MLFQPIIIGLEWIELHFNEKSFYLDSESKRTIICVFQLKRVLQVEQLY